MHRGRRHYARFPPLAYKPAHCYGTAPRDGRATANSCNHTTSNCDCTAHRYASSRSHNFHYTTHGHASDRAYS